MAGDYSEKSPGLRWGFWVPFYLHRQTRGQIASDRIHSKATAQVGRGVGRLVKIAIEPPAAPDAARNHKLNYAGMTNA